MVSVQQAGGALERVNFSSFGVTVTAPPLVGELDPPSARTYRQRFVEPGEPHEAQGGHQTAGRRGSLVAGTGWGASCKRALRRSTAAVWPLRARAQQYLCRRLA